MWFAERYIQLLYACNNEIWPFNDGHIFFMIDLNAGNIGGKQFITNYLENHTQIHPTETTTWTKKNKQMDAKQILFPADSLHFIFLSLAVDFYVSMSGIRDTISILLTSEK